MESSPVRDFRVNICEYKALTSVREKLFRIKEKPQNGQGNFISTSENLEVLSNVIICFSAMTCILCGEYIENLQVCVETLTDTGLGCNLQVRKWCLQSQSPVLTSEVFCKITVAVPCTRQSKMTCTAR